MALDMLGQPAKDSLLEHLRFQEIDLDDGVAAHVQPNAALEPVFSNATGLIMEMIWNYLDG